MAKGHTTKKIFFVHQRTIVSATMIFAVMGSVVAIVSELDDTSLDQLQANYEKFEPETISVGTIPVSVNSDAFIDNKRIHISLAGCFHTAKYLNCELQFNSLHPKDFQLNYLIGAGASADHKVPLEYFSFKTAKTKKIENHDIKVSNSQSMDNPLLLKQNFGMRMTVRFENVPKTITEIQNLTVELNRNSLQFGDVKVDIH